jgi:hypothetical protein
MSCGSKLMSGGAGGADYALKVYGDGGQQRAMPGSNVIAANAVEGTGMMGGAKANFDNLLKNQMNNWEMKGGNDMNNMQQLFNMLKKNNLNNKDLNNVVNMAGGSGVLENVAVPAILLYLNQKVAKRHGKKSMKLRHSSRMSRKNNNNNN